MGDRLEQVHLEVLYSILRSDSVRHGEEEATTILNEEGWIDVYASLLKYLLLALVDQELHTGVAALLKESFWSPRAAHRSQCLGQLSVDTFSQIYSLLLPGGMPNLISENTLLTFLQDCMSSDAEVKKDLRAMLQQFKERSPEDFAATRLGSY